MISRARISRIVDICCVALNGNSAGCYCWRRERTGGVFDSIDTFERCRHARRDFVRKAVAVGVIETFHGNRLEQMYINPARPYQEASPRQNFARAVDDDRNDRRSRCYREHEWSFLESAQGIICPPRALWKNDNGVAVPDALGGHVVRSERGLPVLTTDGHHSHGPHRASENRNLEDLFLGNEFRARQE